MLEKISTYLLFVILLTIMGEAFYSFKEGKRLYEFKDTMTNFIWALGGYFTRLFLKGALFFVWIFLSHYAVFKIPTTVFSVIVLFFLNEFVYYWFHRWSHTIPFFWATHVNHHSSFKLNFSVAARTPFLGAIYHFLFWIPLPLLGFDPILVLSVQTYCFLFNFLQHTTIIPKLGVLEEFLNTPSHHRVHHGANLLYIDKNYGNTLIIFDRIFGTFEREVEEPIYGLAKNPIDRSFFNLIFHGWKELLGPFILKIRLFIKSN